MKEECVVSKIKGGMAYISLAQTEKCGGCKACVFGRGKKTVLPAIMDIFCKEGDRVLVELPQKETAFSLLLCVIPLIFLIVGFIVGGYIGAGGDLTRLIIALLFCASSFAAAVPLERLFRRRREFMPIIIQVLQKATETAEKLAESN